MTTEGPKATAAVPSEAPLAAKEQPEQESAQHGGEGIGVFRALLLTALFYIALGFAVWFAWNLFRQWRGH